MAIAFDNFAVAPAGIGGDVTLGITPVGTPRGVIVMISQANGVDNITGVTYGGTSMSEMTNSPFIGTNSESSAISIFFLGASVPTGTQDAVVSTNDSQGKSVSVITLTASNDTEVNIDSQLLDSESISNPRATLALSSVESFVAEVWTSGKSAVGGVSPIAGWTQMGEADFGAKTSGCYYYDTIGTADVSCGFDNTGGADNAQVYGFAINEISGGGGISIPVVMNHLRNQGMQ